MAKSGSDGKKISAEAERLSLKFWVIFVLPRVIEALESGRQAASAAVRKLEEIILAA